MAQRVFLLVPSLGDPSRNHWRVLIGDDCWDLTKDSLHIPYMIIPERVIDKIPKIEWILGPKPKITIRGPLPFDESRGILCHDLWKGLTVATKAQVTAIGKELEVEFGLYNVANNNCQHAAEELIAKVLAGYPVSTDMMNITIPVHHLPPVVPSPPKLGAWAWAQVRSKINIAFIAATTLWEEHSPISIHRNHVTRALYQGLVIIIAEHPFVLQILESSDMKVILSVVVGLLVDQLVSWALPKLFSMAKSAYRKFCQLVRRAQATALALQNPAAHAAHGLSPELLTNISQRNITALVHRPRSLSARSGTLSSAAPSLSDEEDDGAGILLAELQPLLGGANINPHYDTFENDKTQLPTISKDEKDESPVQDISPVFKYDSKKGTPSTACLAKQRTSPKVTQVADITMPSIVDPTKRRGPRITWIMSWLPSS